MRSTPPDRSPVTLLEEIFPAETNPYGTAFGGCILAMMDRAAGLAASRWAHGHFVTASMDAIRFHAPVRKGEIAEVVATVVYTSAHTCGVKVRVSAVDKSDWKPRPCCQGTILMVAIGPEGRPEPVPTFTPDGEGEQAEWDEVEGVHRRMLQDRGARP